MQRFILDACALLRFLKDEPGAHSVEDFFDQARRAEIVLFMHIINLGEVIYRIGKEFGWEVAEHKRAEIGLLPMKIVAFEESLVWEAVKLKAEFPISYADAFAAAVAIRENATLLTSDPEFEVLGERVPRIRI